MRWEGARDKINARRCLVCFSPQHESVAWNFSPKIDVDLKKTLQGFKGRKEKCLKGKPMED